MTKNNFLLPFREKKQTLALSPTSLTILIIIYLVFILVSKHFLDIAIIFAIMFIFFMSLRANCLRILRVVAAAFLLIFFLGLPSFFLKQGEVLFVIIIRQRAFIFYDQSVFRAIYIWMRGLLSVIIVALYTTTITMQEFVQSLKSLFFPNILVTLILLILRYTPMLFQQGREIRVAQELRGLSSAKYPVKFKAAVSRLGGTLIKSVRHGTQVYEAMVLRGLESNVLVLHSSTKWLDYLIIPLLTGVITLVAGGTISWLL